MKIAFVATVPITIKSFLLDFTDDLARKGHDITWICSPDEELTSLQKEHVRFLPVPIQRGIRPDGLFVISKLKKIFQKEQFDIVQYSTPNASFYASIAARRAGVPCRLYCQWGIRYMGFDGGILRAVFKKLEKVTCQNSTVIECESESIRDFGLSEQLYPEEKSSVIWNGSACGVNLSRYQIEKRDEWRKEKREELNLPEDALVFGFAGRFTTDKGINELLSAFRRLEYDRACLLLVGDFDTSDLPEKEQEDWAKNSERVRFVHWTNEIEKYYSAMDVFVSLSYREGFGLVIIEAAAMGLPSIVSDVPGQRDAVSDGETGLLVPVKNAEKIYEKMREFLNQPEMISETGRNARRFAEEKFDQKMLFEKLLSHRLELLEECRK